jgi:hypothetical protein
MKSYAIKRHVQTVIDFGFRRRELALGLLLAGAPAAFSLSPCDASLVQPAINPYGYHLRGDRCEGIYVQQVSGAPLAVVSWTRSFTDYDLASRQPLKVRWEMAPSTVPIRLRAQGLRRRQYYRMDAVESPGSNSFTWPTDIVSALGISRPDVGIVALTEADIEGNQKEIYLPLRVSQDNRFAPGGSYSLTLLPGIEMKEVYLTLTGPSGAKPSKIKDGEAVGYGYYPAERPIEIAIPGLQSRGFYHLEIGATLRTGGVAAIDFWFYHPGD